MCSGGFGPDHRNDERDSIREYRFGENARRFGSSNERRHEQLVLADADVCIAMMNGILSASIDSVKTPAGLAAAMSAATIRAGTWYLESGT